jgi:uncharacterized membrane protein YhaH (DUF805 family)
VKRRLQLFLGSVATILWLVSYWAQRVHFTVQGDWWAVLSGFTLIGATVATAAFVIIQIVYITDPTCFNEQPSGSKSTGTDDPGF